MDLSLSPETDDLANRVYRRRIHRALHTETMALFDQFGQLRCQSDWARYRAQCLKVIVQHINGLSEGDLIWTQPLFEALYTYLGSALYERLVGVPYEHPS